MTEVTTLRIRTVVLASITLCLFLTLTMGLVPPAALSQAAPPPTATIFAENFESGSLDRWDQEVSPADLSLTPNAGPDASTALAVAVGPQKSYITESNSAQAEEGYLTFWFNPGGVSIPDEGTTWIPSKSIAIANVKGTQRWLPLVALRLRKPEDEGYKAYLEWRAPGDNLYDYEVGEFDIADGWQKITLGYRVDDWIAVWLNDVEMRRITGVQHEEAVGEAIQFGKTDTSDNFPRGQMLFDDIAFGITSIGDLWVDALNGNDSNDGTSASSAFRTIQKAADVAGPGTTVHIQPGIYRETVTPVINGAPDQPALYRAENGPGTAVIRGSEPASSVTWTQLTTNAIGLPPGVDPSNLYFADLSAWELDGPPRFVVQLDSNGNVSARLPLAHEPDWSVATEWKYHEFWWAADGGSGIASCNPATDPNSSCDYPSRSLTELTDRTDDLEPEGIEPGNLTSLGDLTGATLVAMDARQGHYTYRRTIVAHDVAAGRITVDRICQHNGGSREPGLGWGSKYYVEDKPILLDNPGEWWYDPDSQRLYLWPPTPENPASMNLEITQRDVGFDLSHRSYITIDGLDLELFNGSAIYQSNSEEGRSYDNAVYNVSLRHANTGVDVAQATGAVAANVTDGFRLETSEIAYMDMYAISVQYWWGDDSSADRFTHPGIVNTVILNNEFHHLGFRSRNDDPLGALLEHADTLRFEGNYVHHVAHNGVKFGEALVQSPKEYDFSPAELKTGSILIKDNLFEKACLLGSDCGALKMAGHFPNRHVFRDVLITGNVFRNTFGWSWVSEKRGLWAGGPASRVKGLGGFGLYADNASGIHAYRNIAYNNGFAGFMFAGAWRDGDIVYYNNVAANNLFGFRLSGDADRHDGSLNTQLVNNITVNNEGSGILLTYRDGAYGNLVIDHNLYFNNGWRPWLLGGMWRPGAMTIHKIYGSNDFYPTLGQVQANTPWEEHGQAGNPHFQDYDMYDHDLLDGSWPDFRLTAASDKAFDKGTAELPESLVALLARFGVEDSRHGPAFDIGRYEAEFSGQIPIQADGLTAEMGTDRQVTLR